MDRLYRRLFPNERKDAYIPFHREIETHLRDDSRVLDLGCGDHKRMARYRTARRQVWGADVQAHPDLETPRWFRLLGPEGQIPFADASFDLMASCWVLEHVRAPDRFLAEVTRVLRPGGVFINLTVNGGHYVTWITRLFHALPHRLTQRLVTWLYGRPDHDTFETYYRLNDLSQLRRHGRRAGLRLGDVQQVANPDYFRFSRLAWGSAVVADWLAEKIAPGLGRIYWVLTMSKPRQTAIKAAA